MNPIESLREFALELPNVSTPSGSYVSINVQEKIAFIARQFLILNEEYLFLVRLGNEIMTDQGYKTIQLSALNGLAQIEYKIGFDTIAGLNHIGAYFQSAFEWADSPIVVNGASDLFINVLVEKGKHARAVVGVDKLPRNISVGLTASFTIKSA